VLKNKPLGYYLSSGWLFTCLFMALFGNVLPLPKWDDYDFESSGVGLFSPRHFLGTDFDGADLLSQVIHGTRISLMIAFISVAAAMLIGGALGITAAYRRGWVDSVITMYFNVTLSIPTLVLVLVMVAVFSSPDPFNPSAGMPRTLVLILSLTFVIIPVLGRLARSAALSWTGRDFVLVAESIGMKRRSILWTHIVPNVIPSMMSIAFLAAGVLIVVEGGLSILGVGTNPCESWGSILAKNRGDISLIPHTTLIPAAAIALTVMALNYFGDYFRQQIDGREARI
jgi:ABC-type dipeptide/oligopeptide/nickel transport system permease subunit